MNDDLKNDKKFRGKIANQLFLLATYHEKLQSMTHICLGLLAQNAETNNPVVEEAIVHGIVTATFQEGYEEGEKQQSGFSTSDFKDMEEEMLTVDRMEVMGGDFVKKIAAAYRFADQVNRKKLRFMFWNYFTEYLPKNKETDPTLKYLMCDGKHHYAKLPKDNQVHSCPCGKISYQKDKNDDVIVLRGSIEEIKFV